MAKLAAQVFTFASHCARAGRARARPFAIALHTLGLDALGHARQGREFSAMSTNVKRPCPPFRTDKVMRKAVYLQRITKNLARVISCKPARVITLLERTASERILTEH